jgi:hypothetical protein
VAQLGANAHGEVLEPGRVPDCYLGLLLNPPRDQHPGRVLVVAPASLLHPCIPQPGGTLVYELATGHPDRQPQELVFMADLAVELRSRASACCRRPPGSAGGAAAPAAGSPPGP